MVDSSFPLFLFCPEDNREKQVEEGKVFLDLLSDVCTKIPLARKTKQESFEQIH